MASLSSFIQIYPGDTSVVDTVQQYPLGQRAVDTNGNEYIYLKGVTSNAAGAWVNFDEAGTTTLLTTNAVGRVGVAMAAIDSTSEYGWYQVYGKNEIALGTSGAISDNTLVYTSASAGTPDDTDAAGEMVIGAFWREETSGVATVELNYPFVINAAID